jgi:mannose/fructose-specific phosphotransferase system component IIA
MTGMENKDTITGIVVTHGNLARELVDTVSKIVGRADCCIAISNEDLNNDSLILKIRDIMGKVSGGHVILFVDYFGGSCSLNCSRAVKGYPNATVISGVNLPILLDFVTKQGTMKPEEIIEHLIKRGQESVRKIDL